MSTIKESLHHTIDALTDEAAQQVLAFAQRVQRKDPLSATLVRLANDPAFTVSLEEVGRFGGVQPLPGRGRPASEVLIEDRR
jgi:hypothetical protein